MPLEIRGAHFLIRSAQLVRGNTLRIGPGYVTTSNSVVNYQDIFRVKFCA